jgi:predicted XRE-type DNA-binding protein
MKSLIFTGSSPGILREFPSGGAVMSKKDKRITKSSGNVFADLGFEQAEAENLLVRSKLMAAIKTYIESEGITQEEAAKRFHVAQPRISEIYQGKIDLFSVDKLINMLARVGQHVEVTIHKAA